jgi:hypothetical protein
MIGMKRHLLIFAFAGTMFAQAPVRVDDVEARAHQIISVSFIRVPKPMGPAAVPFDVQVNQVGQVVDAKPVPGGRAEYFEAAEKVVRSWRYKPFLRDGQPVEVIARAWIFVLPEEIQPKVHRAFPEVQDWTTVRIKLIRTGCFGSCPSYEVEIQGNGAVTYTGRQDVAVTGAHKGFIAREQLEELLRRFREADFFSFDGKYAANLSDGPTYTTSLTIGKQEQSVVDYYGAEAGMPLVIGELEGAVDEYSGSGKWVRANVDTVPALRAEGFDFKSREAGRILAHVARTGDAEVVRALIQAGAPLDVPDEGGMFVPIVTPLQAAASNADPEVRRLLIEAGASR